MRVADRLLTAAERALTAGNVEDARKNGGRRRNAHAGHGARRFPDDADRDASTNARRCTRAKDSDAQDKQEKGATYLRLANARLRSGALIEPSEDNARFYLEAARQLVPDDPGARAKPRARCRRQLLDRASAAASAGNAAETERWLANADGAGARAPRIWPPSAARCRTR